MRILLFIVFLMTIAVVIPLLASRLLRITNRKIWDSKIIHHFTRYQLYGLLVFVALWVTGAYTGVRTVLIVGVTGTSLLIMTNILLIGTLPLSMAFKKLYDSVRKLRQPIPVDNGRRQALKTGAAFLPLLALGSSGTGVAKSFDNVQLPEIAFRYPGLPDSLDGFRVLHLSDLHLGYYFNLDDLEKLLINLESKQIDTVLITGDVADDLSQLTDALHLIDQLETPFPKFVSLGNHEYHRGINQVKRSIEKGGIPLLTNEGSAVSVHGTHLYIAGADDPVTMRKDIHAFLDNSIKMALRDAPENSFKILMSHRPRALDVASKHHLDLVLSGHTHGGQMGMNGRSVFEPVAPGNYLWGSYRKKKTNLYTSAGVGHWFPFRLGCPAEAPLITLKKG